MSEWYHKGETFNPSYEEIIENGWVGFVYILTNKETGKKIIS